MANIIPITQASEEVLTLYRGIAETHLRRYNEPEPGLFIAESPLVTGRALDAGYKAYMAVCEEKHLETQAAEVLGRCGDIPVYTGSFAELKELLGYPPVRGAMVAMHRKAHPSAEEICRGKHRIAVLCNVVNPTNVGAILRSAAALSMEAVLLTHNCADPLYRRSIRVSMGTLFQVPWTYLDGDPIEALHGIGFKTAAMALEERSVPVDDPALCAEERLAVILGSEGYGLPEPVIAGSDYVVRIPMAEGVDSLNVAAASAVVFWQLRR
ncbi:MAG: RNA methyltransferase [Oscillospiraceae bacterium]|nr:RNA methyltransferase [Oscillospiraceae bacterium]